MAMGRVSDVVWYDLRATIRMGRYHSYPIHTAFFNKGNTGKAKTGAENWRFPRGEHFSALLFKFLQRTTGSALLIAARANH